MGDRLLNGARSIASDLVRRRLLPLALLLVVALVAVPVVISRGGDKPVAPAAVPATPATPAPPQADAAISVSAQAPAGDDHAGPVTDPFYDPPKTPADTPAKTASTTASTPTTATPKTGTSGGSKAPASTTTTPATTPTTPAPTTTAGGGAATATPTIFRTRVRWGADETAAVRGLSRLQPLGDSADPALVYLGTTANHAYALFLLGPNAIRLGDGRCAEDTCHVIALKAGQSTAVGIRAPDGSLATRFALTVDAITEQPAGGAGALDRVHADGRDVLRQIIKDPATAAAIGQFGYDRTLGAVVRNPAP
jgi:hypothetical protein